MDLPLVNSRQIFFWVVKTLRFFVWTFSTGLLGQGDCMASSDTSNFCAAQNSLSFVFHLDFFTDLCSGKAFIKLFKKALHLTLHKAHQELALRCRNFIFIWFCVSELCNFGILINSLLFGLQLSLFTGSGPSDQPQRPETFFWFKWV